MASREIVPASAGELVSANVGDDAGLAVLAEGLVSAARAQGVQLTGPGGLLSGLTRQVLESALRVEMAEHLGYEHLDVGPLPVHVDDDHDPGFPWLVTTMFTAAERSSTSRHSVTVQPSTAIGGRLTCGAQLRHAPDRAAPLAYLARPANRPASTCRLSIAYPRMSGSAIHARTTAPPGPRAEQPDCSRTPGVGRHADAIAHGDRQIASS